MRVNSIEPNFGSALTVHKIYLDGKQIYTRFGPRLISGSEQDQYVHAVMKSLRLNLKEKVDTPVAKKLSDMVTDLYYNFGKKTDILYLPDKNREVTLLTGPEAFTFENIYNNIERKFRGSYLENAISEIFNQSENSKGIFAGFIDIFAATRDMVEPEGKKLFEIIAIDDIEEALK